MNKYNNKKCNGYDSVKEWKRSLELKQMQKDDIIYGLEEQKVFELIPKQIYNGKLQERSCTYIADFCYYDKTSIPNLFIIEDVKGMKTEVYRIKKKLMLYVYGIKIKET